MKLCSLLWIIFFSASAVAQNKLDSLMKLIPKASPNNYRQLIHDTGHELREIKDKKDLEKNIRVFLDNSQQASFAEVYLLAQTETARTYFNSRQESKGLEIALDVYYKAKENGFAYEHAEASTFLSFLYNLHQRNEKTVQYALEATSLYEKLKMPEKAISLIYDMGLVQYRLNNWQKALYMLSKLKEKDIERLSSAEQINYYNALGLIHKKLENYPKSIDYLQRAYNLAKKYQRGDWMGIITGNVGDVYYSQNAIDSARSCWKIDLDSSEKYHLWSNIVATSNYWADSYVKEKRPKEALEYYLKSVKIIGKLPKAEYQNKLNAFRGVSAVYAQLKDFEKAYFYEKLAGVYADSLQNFLKVSETMQIQANTEIAIKEDEILNKKKNAERREIFTWVGIIFLLFIVSVLSWFLRKQYLLNQVIQEQKMDIAEQHEEIAQQNEELLEQQQEILSQTDVIFEKSQEQERLILKLHENEAFLREALDEVIESEKIINEKNEALQTNNKDLEEKVDLRTHELSEANKELLQTNSQLEQFAYVIAHNLRSPIARLRGLVSCIDLNTPDNPENFKILEYIGVSSLELDAIVKDLNKILEIKKNVKEVYELVNVYERISENLENMKANNPEVDFDLDLNLQVNEIYSVKAYINSIFYNLLSNAFKYRVTSRKLVITIKILEKKDFVHVEFSDNGLGIDLEKFKDKIFTPYKRFHEGVEGKGLGLHLVKLQVEALGGKLDIQSTVNVGTTFTIGIKK